MKKQWIYIFCFVVLVLVLTSSESFAQCAMCKATVESAENDGSLPIGKGLNKGILYLMGIPYVLLFFLFRTKLKAFYKEFFQTAR